MRSAGYSAAPGARLAVADSHEAGLSELRAELADAGVKHWGWRADAAKFADFEDFLAAARAELGPVSGLVNVAGTFSDH